MATLLSSKRTAVQQIFHERTHERTHEWTRIAVEAHDVFTCNEDFVQVQSNRGEPVGIYLD